MDIDFLLTLRNPPCTTAVLLAVVSHGNESCGVAWIAERVGWNEKAVRLALKSLVSIDFLVRVHHRGWIASEVARKVIHKLSTGSPDDRLKRYFTASDGKVPPEAVPGAASGLCMYDDDHYIDREIDTVSLSNRLKSLGFYRPAEWLADVNVQLVAMWLDWHDQLSSKHKRKYKNIGGLIRKNVLDGMQPDEIWKKKPLDYKVRVPDEYKDVVQR